MDSISRLGRITEPPAFWTTIANNEEYSVGHRSRAVFALFRRHCYADTVRSLGLKLEPAKWLKDGDIQAFESEVHVGPMPIIEINDTDSIFDVKVLGGFSVYVRVSEKMSRDDFSRLLRNDRTDLVTSRSDGVILECAYGDDYEKWLHAAAFGKTGTGQ
jgi:hypothetical protein